MEVGWKPERPTTLQAIDAVGIKPVEGHLAKPSYLGHAVRFHCLNLRQLDGSQSPLAHFQAHGNVCRPKPTSRIRYGSRRLRRCKLLADSGFQPLCSSSSSQVWPGVADGDWKPTFHRGQKPYKTAASLFRCDFAETGASMRLFLLRGQFLPSSSSLRPPLGADLGSCRRFRTLV